MVQNAQTAATKSTPKIISRTLATGAVFFISWLVLPSFWFWVSFEVIALLLVVIGCGGEWYLHIHPAGRKKKEKDEHHKLESRFIASVALGVTMELFSLGHTIKEGVKLEREVASLNKDAKRLDAQLTSNKTELAKAEGRLIELRIANQPIDIGEQLSFAASLKKLPGIQVKLRSALDPKSMATADNLASVITMAGWTIFNRAPIGNIGREGIAIGYSEDALSRRAAIAVLKELIARTVPCELVPPNGVRGLSSNAIIIAVMSRPASRLKSELMQAEAEEALANLADREKHAELSVIRERMSELSSKQFAPGSKELAEAQTEYNDLSARQEKLTGEVFEKRDVWKSLDRIRALRDALDKEESTNPGPGLHVFNSGPVPTNMVRLDNSNATVIIRGFNLPRLE